MTPYSNSRGDKVLNILRRSFHPKSPLCVYFLVDHRIEMKYCSEEGKCLKDPTFDIENYAPT